MKRLYISLKEAGLMLKSQGETDFIILEFNENGTTSSVDINTFETLFKDVEGNPTYEALSSSHTFNLEATQYTMTAEEMGYQKYFDQWKEQGIFNFRDA